MIGKTKIGTGFKGTVYYCLQENKRPEILCANGLVADKKAELMHEFVAISSENRNISKPVWHSSLSFPADDKINDEFMATLANRFMQKAGFTVENNQWIVIKHNDTDHVHCHIIANRVGFDGKAVSDYYSKSKTVQWAKEIEAEYGLVKAQDLARKRREELQLSKVPAPDKTFIKTTIDDILKRQEIKSLDSLADRLKQKGVTMLVLKHTNTGKPYGVSFHMGNTVFKGSDIGKQYAFKSLKDRFSAHPSKKNQNLELNF